MTTVTPRKRRCPSEEGGLMGNESPFLVSASGRKVSTRSNPTGLPTPESSTKKPRPTTHHTPSKIKQPIFLPLTPSYTRDTSSLSSSSSSLLPPADLPTLPTLPPHLQTLLLLHQALDLSLSLHLATHPPILPPSPHTGAFGKSGDTGCTVMFENVGNYVAVKEMVEKSSKRRFGLGELRKLKWIWEYDPPAPASDPRGGNKDEGISLPLLDAQHNPFLPPTPAPSPPATFSFPILHPTRTLSPHTSRPTQTYGLSLLLPLTPAEAFSAGNSLISFSASASVAAVGRWSAGAAGRGREVERRLRCVVEQGGVVGEGELPELRAGGGLLPAVDLFGSTTAGGRGGGNAQGKGKGKAVEVETEVDVFGPVVVLPKPGIVGKGSVEQRRQALYDRIKARSAPTSQNTLSASVRGKVGNMSSGERQEELERRSRMSRLEGVAEGVWMFFSLSPSNVTASPGSSPRARRRAFPLSEVAEVVVKSSKTPISIAEAKDSLLLLTQLCPSFLLQRTIARQEWLEMPVTGGGSYERGPTGEDLPVGGGSPRMAVTGRRAGGLAEVRERVRKELGEW